LDNLAPIVLFVYNRPDHTKKTIEALLKNSITEKSELFIYSDGPKTADEKEKIYSVRNYIHGLSGFKNINIVEREENLGLAQSVISGVSEVINEYEKAIVLEDDMICSPFFLEFINTLLSFYKNNDKVFSVTGYTFPINISSSYSYDVYVAPRASSWGWGTWKNRWEKVDWDVKDFNEFITDSDMVEKFNLGGEDLTRMLKNQKAGRIDSWAIIWTYAHFINNTYCAYPVKSRIRNIGTDKSGVHTGKTTRFDVDLDFNNSPLDLPKNITPDEKILNNFRKFFKKNKLSSILNKIRN
jgi:Glycosyl transferase family 2